MKFFIFFVVTVIVSSFSFSQHKIVFVDSFASFPIENVGIYNSKMELLSISNEQGVVYLDKNKFPLQVRATGYEPKEISEYKDTLRLTTKYQLLEEVKVKPIPIAAFYERILNESNRIAREDTNEIISGTYFESALFIDATRNDTLLLVQECSLTIRKKHQKKSIDYSMIASSGKKQYWKSSSDGFCDTAIAKGFMGFLPKFNNFFEYDLLNTNNYKIKFDDNEIIRHPNSFEVVDEVGKKRKNTTIIQYHGDTLISRNATLYADCNSQPNKNASLCYELSSIKSEFNKGANGYYLNNYYIYGDLYMTVGSKNIIIKLKRGFVENQNENQNDGVEVKKIENYFNGFGYSNELDLIHLYSFPE